MVKQITTPAILDDWSDLENFLPSNWQELAHLNGALKGLHKDKSPSNILRTILMHCGCGLSLRETATHAKEAKIANLTDVGFMKRFKKSASWLRAMCIELFKERGTQMQVHDGLRLRLFDATHVQEPGATGTQWRVHYSLCLPDLGCDYFDITRTKGEGTGESCTHFPIAADDYILADRGYCRGSSIEYVSKHNAYIAVRYNHKTTVLFHPDKTPFSLVSELRSLKTGGDIKEWDVAIKGKTPDKVIPGRLCVIRKTKEHARKDRKKRIRQASKKGYSVGEETLFLTKYIIVFTTFPKKYSTTDILDFYRLRWQIELAFKRFKQIANLGHLPKYDPESAKAWLYGKLFTALLTEKLIVHADAISPWRSENEEEEEKSSEISMEGVLFYVSHCIEGHNAIFEHDIGFFKLA